MATRNPLVSYNFWYSIPKTERVLHLISEGYNINQETPTFHNTPLSMAVRYKHNYHNVKVLLEHGANINHLDTDNDPPLRMTIDNGDIAMSKLLLDHGADITIIFSKPDILLLIHETDMIKLLVNHGMDVGYILKKYDVPNRSICVNHYLPWLERKNWTDFFTLI